MVPQPFPTCLVAACCCSSWCLLCLSPAMTSARTCCPRRPPTLLHHPPPSPRPSPLLPVRGDTCGATITSKATCARGSSTLTTSTFSRSRRTARSAAPRRRTAPSVSTAPTSDAGSPGRGSPEPGGRAPGWGRAGEWARGGGGVGSAGTPLPARLCRALRQAFALQMASPSAARSAAWQKSKLEKICKGCGAERVGERRLGGWGEREKGETTLSPESENHYPLLLTSLDENAILKQCTHLPPVHTLSSLSEPQRGCLLRAPPPRSRGRGFSSRRRSAGTRAALGFAAASVLLRAPL